MSLKNLKLCFIILLSVLGIFLISSIAMFLSNNIWVQIFAILLFRYLICTFSPRLPLRLILF